MVVLGQLLQVDLIKLVCWSTVYCSKVTASMADHGVCLSAKQIYILLWRNCKNSGLRCCVEVSVSFSLSSV